jgi:hypothetical protein
MPKTTSNPQYVSVEQPFGTHQTIVHCPICGQPTIKPGAEDEACEITPCPHLAFIYINEISEFEYKSPDFAKRTKKIEDYELGDDFKKKLKKAGYDNKLLILEITYGGMACGPVWYTDVYGFDYGTLKSEDEE